MIGLLILVTLGHLMIPHILWTLYLAVMGLKRARDQQQLSAVAARLGFPILVLGYLVDFYMNMVHMTIVLWEFPQELTVSERLKRHLKTSAGLRHRIASKFVQLLDPFDPSGRHIS